MTVDKQPRALYLADVLAAGFECDQEWYEIESARELRRLHAENAELLEALKAVTKHLDVGSRNTSDLEAVWAAEKIIAKAEGETK